MNNTYYGIEVEYQNGDTFYFGKGYESFLKQNILTGRKERINDKCYSCANLNETLIKKNGFVTESSCDKAKEKFDTLVKFDNKGNKSAVVKTVKLTPSLVSKINRTSPENIF